MVLKQLYLNYNRPAAEVKREFSNGRNWPDSRRGALVMNENGVGGRVILILDAMRRAREASVESYTPTFGDEMMGEECGGVGVSLGNPRAKVCCMHARPNGVIICSCGGLSCLATGFQVGRAAENRNCWVSRGLPQSTQIIGNQPRYPCPHARFVHHGQDRFLASALQRFLDVLKGPYRLDLDTSSFGAPFIFEIDWRRWEICDGNNEEVLVAKELGKRCSRT